jgi:hypothetical protein
MSFVTTVPMIHPMSPATFPNVSMSRTPKSKLGLTGHACLLLLCLGSTFIYPGTKTFAGPLVSFYADETIFNTVAPGLETQVFGGTVKSGTMNNPLNHTTESNLSGPILPGIEFTGKDVATAPQLYIGDYFGTINKAVFPNSFTASLDITFANLTDDVGLGLLSEFTSSNIRVTVFDHLGNSIGTQTVAGVANAGQSTFLGIHAIGGVGIAKVNLQSTDTEAPGVDRVTFGSVPESPVLPVASGLLAMVYAGRRAIRRHRG